MTILVTGGAGYIGSHAVKALVANGYRVVVVDNLSRGNKEAVHTDASLEVVDLCETDQLAKIMQEHDIHSVMHFAGYAYVGESVEEPLSYYENNTACSLSLLQAMELAHVKHIIFSSSCAVYGIPDRLPVVESTPQIPVNPYGHSKRMVEQILLDKAAIDPAFSFTALRYFNVAGCAADGSIGEVHEPETHLIPLIIKTGLGHNESICIFGSDYPTADGTCIRDYVHVEDLCGAHLLALESMKSGDTRFYNVGIGKGYSVREVIQAVERIIGCRIPVSIADRRVGDPPELYSSADLIRNDLGWTPKLTQLDEIIDTAWSWFRQHPDGYVTGP